MRLTITQRIKIIQTYYKNSDSATATYHALRVDFGAQNSPITQAIVKKFEETRAVTNIEWPVHHRFVRSAENIAIVSDILAEDPSVSIPLRFQELVQSHGTL